MCNAYSELNDPIDQRERFAAQDAAFAAGDEEANHTDEDFLNALEHRYASYRRYRLRHRPSGNAADQTARQSVMCLLFPTMKTLSKENQ